MRTYRCVCNNQTHTYKYNELHSLGKHSGGGGAQTLTHTGGGYWNPLRHVTTREPGVSDDGEAEPPRPPVRRARATNVRPHTGGACTSGRRERTKLSHRSPQALMDGRWAFYLLFHTHIISFGGATWWELHQNRANRSSQAVPSHPLPFAQLSHIHYPRLLSKYVRLQPLNENVLSVRAGASNSF